MGFLLFSFSSKVKQGLLPSLEDLLFYTIAEGQEKIPVHKFITVSSLLQNAVWKLMTARFFTIKDNKAKYFCYMCLNAARNVTVCFYPNATIKVRE